MPKGGKRPGAGRKPGGQNKFNEQMKRRALGDGITPLQYMLDVMRDENADLERRDDMAKSAAKYIHPTMQSVSVDGDMTMSYVVRAPSPATNADEWQQQHSPDDE